MQYLLDEKEKNFSLFGCYPYKLLKSKKILENLNEDVLYKIELPQLKEKIRRADRQAALFFGFSLNFIIDLT